MGTILASSIIDKAEIQLRDAGNAQWSAAELLGWLNDGQRQIAILKSDANVTVSVVQLVQGTRQTVPLACILLLDVVRNMGTNGSTPGAPITYIKRRDLDLERPTWHADTASATVQHFTYSQKVPGYYFVYPPQPNSNRGYVELEFNAVPVDVLIGDAISISDIYSTALMEYVLFRAYGKESKSASNASKSKDHYGLFLTSLGMQEQREQSDDASGDKLRKVDEP
jgi:hypothetical protein